MNIDLTLKKTSARLNKLGITTANLDAIVLLEKALGKEKSDILTHNSEPLTNSESFRFRRLIRRRELGEPIAYILEQKEFFGYNFFVNKNVLIPRPETELIVEKAIDYLKSHEFKLITNPRSKISNLKNKEKISILDIGTGSGCIIISLILTLKARSSKPEASFFASDISKKALYVAKKNAKMYKLNKQIHFFKSDLFSNPKMPKKYDLIIANLPYVPKNSTSYDLESKNLRHEPQDAIFAQNNGTEIIKKFLYQTKNCINKDGLILIEVDPRNARELKSCAKNIFRELRITILKDLSGNNRVIKILN